MVNKTDLHSLNVDALDFEKGDGIIPVIVQDADSGEVLTLAYCNREALQRAIDTGKSWFWSRSRQRLWMKGEESGNTQDLVRIQVDCDMDALMYVVRPSGPACHMGMQSCFHHGIINIGKIDTQKN